MHDDGEPLWDPGATMARHGARHLRALAGAVGFPNVEEALALYAQTTEHWGEARVSDFVFRSNFTSDQSPLEFAVATSATGDASLRWNVDCVSAARDRQESRANGLRVFDRLGGLGADLERFRLAAPLLAPEADLVGSSSLGVGVDFRRADGPLFKAYFFSGGVSAPEGRTCAALEALRMRGAARALRELFADGHRAGGVSIDLTSGPGARVKAYVLAPRGGLRETLARLNAIVGEGADKLAHAEHFVATLAGVPVDELDRASDAAMMTLQFVAGADAPCGLAVNFDMHPLCGVADCADWPPNDDVVAERMSEVFRRHNVPAGAYRRALAAFARVPLRREYMLHNFAAFQGAPGRSSITAYLSARFHAYRMGFEELLHIDAPGEAAPEPVTG
jgi:hypothetical protein